MVKIIAETEKSVIYNNSLIAIAALILGLKPKPHTPIRIGFDIPTFQTIFHSDGSSETIVNPALPKTDQKLFKKQLNK